LFPRGASQIGIPVEARIWPAAGIDTISMRIGQQRIIHRNAVERFQPLAWPGQDAAIELRGQRDYTLAVPGEWGLFRLLDQAQVRRREDRDLYITATWSEIVPGVPVIVDFKPSTLHSALRGLRPPAAVTAARSPCGN
jgi:type VI protein secretion system component VasK